MQVMKPMKTTRLPNTPVLYFVAALFFVSCANMQETAQVGDDVYYVAKEEPMVLASTDAVQEPSYGSDDDYYNPDVARDMERNYYDVTYRDPQYYNMSRFGWNGPSWGMSMGNPMGPGYGGYYNTGSYWGGGSSFYGYDPFSQPYYGNSWGSSYYNQGWGTGYYGGYSPNWMYGNYGYGNPYYGGFGSPYGGFGNPYAGFGNPYGGYGYNPFFGYNTGYYGPGGTYFCPSYVYGGGFTTAASAYYGHRNSMNSFATGLSGGSNSGFSKISNSSPMRLIGAPERARLNSPNRLQPTRTGNPNYQPRPRPDYSQPDRRDNGRLTAPTARPSRNDRDRNRENTRPSVPRKENTTPNRSGGSRGSGGQRRR